MNKKAILAGTVFAGAVATPIALTINSAATAYETNPYAVMLSTAAPFKTLNKFKVPSTADSDKVLGMFTCGLFRAKPQGKNNGGLDTALALQNLSVGAGQPDPGAWATISDPQTSAAAKRAQINNLVSDDILNSISFHYGALTTDIAESVAVIGTPSDADGLAVKLRNNARYWNGDRVSAEDFIQTIEAALDAKNGVPWAWQVYQTMGLYNADKIWDAQTKGMSFEDAKAKYPLGIMAGGPEIPVEDMSTSIEGRSYYRTEYAAGRKRHSKILYHFNGNHAITFLTSYALNTISTPTNIRHFERVGLDSWGSSIENLMGCGPYKLAYFDLDYKIVSNRWSGYWDATRVISPQIEFRVLPDISSNIQMFKDGKIGTVSFGTAMLPQFFGSAQLRQYVKPTNWAEALTAIPMNTTVQNKNAKWMLQADFRRAIQYSIDRASYLKILGADNTFPAEAWTTLQAMVDGAGAGPRHHAITFDNDVDFVPGLNPSTPASDGSIPPRSHVEEWNRIYKIDDNDPMASLPGGYDQMFSRDESELTSKDTAKNDKSDKVYNPQLARRYYDQFRRNNPDFNGIELRFLVAGAEKDNVLIIKQNIEQNLPGVKVKIMPKPTLVIDQVKARLEWDITTFKWSYDFRDPWTFYHLLADKVTQSNAADEIVRARQNNNRVSDGLSLIDFVAQKISEDPDYFAKRFLGDANKRDLINPIIAQFVMMETVIGSNNPESESFKSPVDNNKYITSYNDIRNDIWSVEPSEDNSFNSYGKAFDKFEPYFKGASQWGDNLKAFIEQYGKGTSDTNFKDKWRNKDYRFQVIYPTIEKIIRDSAIGTAISRIQNTFIASKLIGQLNFADEVQYLGFVYQADRIPPSTYTLPGKESLTA